MRQPLIDRPSTRRIFSAPKRWSQPTPASNVSSAYLPSLVKFAKLQGGDAPSGSAQRQAELWARCCAHFVVGIAPESAVSSRAISRAAFRVAMRVRREATLLCLRRSSRRPPAHVVRARQTTPTSEGRRGGHAMGRQPWSPRTGSAVFGPAPSSRELPVPKSEGVKHMGATRRDGSLP